MTSKLAVRAAEDIDGAALSYAEIKMLATGNSLIKEKMELEVAVSKLRLLKSSHLNQRYHLEDQLRQYYPVKIRKLREEIAGREQDVVHLKAHTPTPSEQFPPMLLGGMTYTDKKEAGLELFRSCEQPSITPREIGSYRGFQMEIFFVPRENACVLLLKNALTYSVALGKDPLGNLVRIDNKLEQIEKDLYKEKRNLENLLQQQKKRRRTSAGSVRAGGGIKGKTNTAGRIECLVKYGTKGDHSRRNGRTRLLYAGKEKKDVLLER